MTILVLFSTSFVIIDEHYCQGKLENFSVFGKADECDMTMSICKMENHKSSISKSSCCTNITKLKQASIFEQNLETSYKFQISDFNPIGFFNTWDVLSTHIEKNKFFQNYFPPLIFKDILIFIQCFRI